MTTRPAPLTDEQMPPEMHELFARWRLDGELYSIFRLLSRNPALAKAWTVFGTYIFARTGLSVRQSELLILRTTWLSGSEYEYAHHVQTALRREVLDDEEQRAIIAGPGDPRWSSEEAALLQAADDIDALVRISDDTWDALSATFTPEQILDIVYTCGAYRVGAAAMNTFRVPIEASVPRPAELPALR